MQVVFLSDKHRLKIRLNKSTTISDVFSSLQFVSGKHPYFDIYPKIKKLNKKKKLLALIMSLIVSGTSSYNRSSTAEQPIKVRLFSTSSARLATATLGSALVLASLNFCWIVKNSLSLIILSAMHKVLSPTLENSSRYLLM